MTLAPFETNTEYQRKVFLLGKLDDNTITKKELIELQDLTRNAVSHLTYNKVTSAKGI